MNYIFIDLDCTLIDTRDLVISGGPEPEPGSAEHEAWVAKITEPSVLKAAPPVEAVLALLRTLMYSYDDDLSVHFLTNRRERMRTLTDHWLHKNLDGLEYSLLMRPNDCMTRAGQFKAELVNKIAQPKDTVIIIDDDPDGSIESEWKKRSGWVHLKITTF
jgi:hypothetical protein